MAGGQEYTPGQPGADWTREEVEVMRKRVLATLTTGEFNRNFNEMALFRLSFHDCVPYADGGGGCDGKKRAFF